MNFSPKISIIIPVYNGSAYLRSAIDSALNQTYRNCEVLVVNDGSSDQGATEEIARSYGDKIRYFSKSNGGVSSALNRGIQEMHGEYFSWLSHDDWYPPEKLHLEIEYLNTLADKNVFLYGNVTTVNENTGEKKYYDFPSPETTEDIIEAIYCSRINFCTALVSKQILIDLGGFVETSKTVQDYEVLFKIVDAGILFKHIRHSLLFSRHHDNQGCHKMYDIHLKELNYLYNWGTDLLFDKFIRNASSKFVNVLADIMSERGLAPKKLLSSWMFFRKCQEDNIPILWQYWETPPGQQPPPYMQYCNQSVEHNCGKNVGLIRLDETTVPYFLPNLHKGVLQLERIAHKADYYRFQLLYRYGGIWLDSDIILFRSLDKILPLIQQHGFVFTGYTNKCTKDVFEICSDINFHDGEVFPLIAFLGSLPGNEICKEMINRIEVLLSKLCFQPDFEIHWDDIGGNQLRKILTEKNSFGIPIPLFSPIEIYNNKSLFDARDFKVSSDVFAQFLTNSADRIINTLTLDQIRHTDNALRTMFALAGLSMGEITGELETSGIIPFQNQDAPKVKLASHYDSMLTAKEERLITLLRRLKQKRAVNFLWHHGVKPCYKCLRSIYHFPKNCKQNLQAKMVGVINQKNKFCPKVSVIIPVYNGANYLKDAIESVLAQTYQNIEILVINDGSNDNGATKNVAERFGQKIRYFNKKNGGVASAMNLGIKEMDGEYFSWLSHDDLYKPQKIEAAVNELNGLADKRTVLYSDWEGIDAAGRVTFHMRYRDRFTEKQLNTAPFPLTRGCVNGCTLLIHRSWFQEVGTFDETLPTTQDFDLWIRLFQKASIRHIPRPLVQYREHQAQTTKLDLNNWKSENVIWIKMMNEFSDEIQNRIAQTPRAFFWDIYSHLQQSALTEAKNFALKSFLERLPAFTVILPTYNRAYCINRALSSILNQTFQDFEILVIDDGSTDDTEKILLKDPRISYIFQKNQGVSSARNNGLRNARGKYIAFLDSDDEWLPEHLERHFTFHEENPEIKLLYGGAYTFNQENIRIGQHGFPIEGNAVLAILCINKSFLMTPTITIVRDIFDHIEPFHEKMTVCEDLDLWLRIANKYRIEYVAGILTKVHLREHSFNIESFVEFRYLFLKKEFSEMKANLSLEKCKSIFQENMKVYLDAGVNRNLIDEICNKFQNDFPDMQQFAKELTAEALVSLRLDMIYLDLEQY